jgi:metal-dependent amidase/aminoacylase/carboxypeptidase family protein
MQGEENGGGKINLIKAGYYKDVDINLMCHPTLYDGCYVPFIAIQSFEVEYFGRSAHAALAPWEGINALEGLLQAFQNINALRQTIRPDMVLHGIILEGGKANNVIPYCPI